MASSITDQEDTQRSILEASGPPNVLGAPVQAENRPRLLFLPSPGPENSPNGVANGLSLALAAITPKWQFQNQPTKPRNLPQLETKPSRPLGGPTIVQGPHHAISHRHGTLKSAQKAGLSVHLSDVLHEKTTR